MAKATDRCLGHEPIEYDEVDARIAAFLADLEAICDKHGIADIFGCGCCGSPRVIVEGYEKELEHAYSNLGRNDSGVFYVERDGYDRDIKPGEYVWMSGFDITKDGKVAKG